MRMTIVEGILVLSIVLVLGSMARALYSRSQCAEWRANPHHLVCTQVLGIAKCKPAMECVRSKP